MMKFDLLRNRFPRSTTKVKPAALAFFLCLWQVPVTSAITNQVSGTAFGTDYAALASVESIASVSSGNGSLAIGFAGTTNISLNHNISGSIAVTNNFSRFSIVGSGSTISNSQSFVLFVEDGSNLTVMGGSYAGVGGTDGNILPPLPGETIITNAISSAGTGGLFIRTTNVMVEGAAFSGGGYLQDSTTARATDGLLVAGTTIMFSGSSNTLTGGSAGSASALSQGGRGLAAYNSVLVVSNGTFSGGNAGPAADSQGGDALYATNSTVDIIAGSLTGGGGNGGTGGAALHAADSEVHVFGGTLLGGAEASALIAVNSDLTVEGGIITGGASGTSKQFGLVSWADSGVSNQIVLNGGTFNSIDFSGDGYQRFTAGTNLVVEDFVVQDGGTVFVDNLSDDPLQTTFIRDGMMIMNTDFTLSDGGFFALVDANSQAKFTSLTVASNAAFDVGTGVLSAGGAFNLQAGGELLFAVISETNGALFADQANFESNAIVYVDAQQANYAGNTTNQVAVLTTTNGIFVAGMGATNSAVFKDQVSIQTDTSGRTVFNGLSIENGNRLQLEFVTQDLAGYWGATGQFALLANELDNINKTAMLAIIDLINDPEQSRAAVEQAYLTAPNTLQSSLIGLQAALGHTSVRGAEFREMLKLIPAGAKGPERHNEIRGWGKGYGSYLSHEADGLNSRYDTSQFGGVIGVDKSFNNLLLGLSGGSGASSTKADTNAKEEVTAHHGSVYGTYGFDQAHVDAGVAFSFNEVETESAAPFVMRGEFDARLFSAYLSGGYDLTDTKGGTVFTPEVAVQYSVFEQDDYTETSETAVPRRIDAYDTYSLRTSIGINTSMLQTKALENFGFKIDGQLHWIHEFNPEPEDITFSLEGGSNRFHFAPASLDADLFRLGIGASFFNTKYHNPKNVMLRIDFAELIGKDFISHNLSAKVIYAF